MLEFGGGEAGDVLEKDGSGLDVLDQVQGGWEHVAVVVGAELLAGDAERRTWNTSSKEVDACEVLVAKVADVLLDDVPVRPVLPQGRAELRLILDSGSVVEASHLETEGLTTTACAKFQDGKTHVSES